MNEQNLNKNYKIMSESNKYFTIQLFVDTYMETYNYDKWSLQIAGSNKITI